MMKMKEILRYQHEYNKQSSKSSFMFNFLFAVLLALVTGQAVNPVAKDILLIAVFIYLLIMNFKNSYYEDLYYSRIIDYRQHRAERYLETYRRLKDEHNLIKKLRLAYFGFGLWNNIQNLSSVLFIIFVVILTIIY